MKDGFGTSSSPLQMLHTVMTHLRISEMRAHILTFNVERVGCLMCGSLKRSYRCSNQSSFLMKELSKAVYSQPRYLLFQGGPEPLRAFRPGHTQSSASEGADGSETILGHRGVMRLRLATSICQAYSAGGRIDRTTAGAAQHAFARRIGRFRDTLALSASKFSGVQSWRSAVIPS